MYARAMLAVRKLAFCIRVSPNISTFLKLARNAKEFSWSQGTGNGKLAPVDKASAYRLKLNSHLRQVHLRTLSGDIKIFFDVFWRSTYPIPPNFPRGGTIVDLGAHIGMVSLFFRLNTVDAKIYSIEPDIDSFQLILKNLEPEITLKDVIPINAAIASQNKPIYLKKSTLGYNTSVSDTASSISVKGMTIQELIATFEIKEIDLLKVDIEGAEAILFSGDISWLAIVNNILIEIHSEQNRLKFQEAALSHGFILKKLVADHEEVYWAFKSISRLADF